MAERNDEHGGSILIGPGIEGPGLSIDDLPEPGDAPPQVEGRRLLLRLVIAFVICVILAAVCFVVLPANGVDMPGWIPLVAMAIIAVAALTTAKAEGQLPSKPACSDGACGCDDGRPVGCCSGPRPLRAFREPPRRG
ncbi:MAG: hypothetical protein IT431_09540 [Phycisphaerales bacterium]|nr:hypothetical protein [Phycisphaerales bacterium]